MTELEEMAQTLAAIRAALDALGVTWAVGGSLASAVYGEPRATNDIDVVAALDVDQARALTNSLADTFYADGDVAAEAVRSRRSFNVIDTRNFIKVDVFTPGPGAMGQGQLLRRRDAVVLTGLPPLSILGPEDVILQKLRWFRIGGEVSDQQWRDIMSVMTLTSELDTEYLDEVARANNLVPLLARARAEAAVA